MPGLRVLDGVFLAMRRDVARLVRKHPSLAGAPSPATHAFVRIVADRAAAAAFAVRWRFVVLVASCETFFAEIAVPLALV